jgi:protein-tyrosine phosphatase
MTELALEQLARTINLRDLGGTPAAGGREVRRGALYRSAALGELTPPERAALAALRLGSIIDLRYNSERAEQPTPWEDLGCRTYWAHDHEPGAGGLSDMFADGSFTHDAARDMMIRAYRDLPFRQVEALQRLFRSLGAGDGPVLFHCTSGKDRTGISAALVLSTLGSSRDAIEADYIATLKFDILASAAFRDCPPERLDALKPIYTVHRDYLEAMFEAIEGRHGSVEGFLVEAVGLKPAELAALRETLLA